VHSKFAELSNNGLFTFRKIERRKIDEYAPGPNLLETYFIIFSLIRDCNIYVTSRVTALYVTPRTLPNTPLNIKPILTNDNNDIKLFYIPA